MNYFINELVYGTRLGRENQVIGELVAFKQENKVYIGWSFCHENDYKKLTNKNKYREFRILTRKIAEGRALKNFSKDVSIPYVHTTTVVNFIIRARKYFKDSSTNDFPVWSRKVIYNGKI
jgi:hypothetical protein